MNLTWRLEVDSGFDYLIRLHFCELNRQVNGNLERIFEVLFNDVLAEEVDTWEISGGFAKALYRDYIVSLFGQSNGTKVPLVLALRPKHTLSDSLFVVISCSFRLGAKILVGKFLNIFNIFECTGL